MSSSTTPSVEEIIDAPETPLPELSSAESSYEFNGSVYPNAFDLELAISLEFLSCIQSDHIISFQRICDVVMPAFLHYLSKGNLINNSQNGSSSDMYKLFLKIQEDIRATRENFERLKQWEETLDHLVKDLLVRDWEWEGKFSDKTAHNSGDLSVGSQKLYQTLCEIDTTVTKLRQHIEPPCSVLSSTPVNHLVQSSSSNISTTDEESSDHGFSVNISGTVPSHDFQARYEILSPDLQKCLLYFSAFPATSKIRKKALKYLWIGEGFINPTTAEGLSSEDIAANYFKELVAKGFIEPVDEKDSGDFGSCKMSLSVHSAVVLLAKNSGFFDFDDRGKPTTDFVDSRRACLSRTEDGSLEKLVERVDDSNREKLFTLFNLDETYPEFPKGWFSKVNNVTTLCLGSWRSSNKTTFLVENTEFLEDLGNLKYLRCLSLNRIYKIKKLPKSISKLGNLMILDLKSCYDLQELPDAIGSLENLTHLDMSECHLIDHMPKGLCKLLKLLVLKGFVLSGDPTTSQDQCSLADLVKLEKLRKLTIYTNRKVTGNEGQLNSLSEFKALQVLTISWTRAPSRTPPRKLLSLQSLKSKRHDIVEVSNPCPLPASLEKLDLRCWPLQAMPRWVNPSELQKLNKLYIRGGGLRSAYKEMHHSYQWTVKILRLQYLKELEMDWQIMLQLFPNLVYLDKIDCPMLASFPDDGVWKPENQHIRGRHP